MQLPRGHFRFLYQACCRFDFLCVSAHLHSDVYSADPRRRFYTVLGYSVLMNSQLCPYNLERKGRWDGAHELKVGNRSHRSLRHVRGPLRRALSVLLLGPTF
jgi:hypothetical protein